eukprot:CAMPEP_0196591094 /NCGR_PEP_ID=MMETSP1081-20130531/68509_1 /TAXON_ID=36882 /ORGANISM="Pyramimonas amylifera, Strain CCMP720" /LENGTH=143 /DNA_ID=CAMNT_0041914361 /DNA_START=258 /DNA_END=689 /DNA_ORIENTATION=+
MKNGDLLKSSYQQQIKSLGDISRREVSTQATKKSNDSEQDGDEKSRLALEKDEEMSAFSTFLRLPVGTQISLAGGGVLFFVLLNSFGIRTLVTIEGLAVNSIMSVERALVGFLIFSLKYIAIAGVLGLIVLNIYWNIKDRKNK